MMTGSTGEVSRVTRGLKGHHGLARNVKGVHAQLRQGHVGGLSMHLDAEQVHGGIVQSRLQAHCPDGQVRAT